MKVRDLVKIIDFDCKYYHQHLTIFDKSGMIECGHFNSFYRLPENDPLLDYEILQMSGDYYVRIDIDENEAKNQEAAHKEARHKQLYGKE